MKYRLGLQLTKWRGICVLCRHRPMVIGYLCQACDDEMDWLTEPLVLEVAEKTSLIVQPANYYQGVMAKAIAAFKDSENLQTLPFLVHALTKLAQNLQYLQDTQDKNNGSDSPLSNLSHNLSHNLSQFNDGFDDGNIAIVPVPTTPHRLVERGFAPVDLLATYLSAMTGFEIYDGVVRPYESDHQRGLGRDERLSNVQGAFVLHYPPPCQTLILFDDVVTTGATLNALAQALLQHNPNLTLYAVCLAHGNNSLPS